MRFIRITLMLMIASNAFTQTVFVGVESMLKNYNEYKYFSFTINVLNKEFQDNNIEIHSVKQISKSSKNNKGLNALLIPQFLLQYDTISNEEIVFYFDSINPINRAIIFDESKYLGSLLFTEQANTIYCPCLSKSSAYTDFFCGKYIYRENKYSKTLRNLLKKKPVLVFKDPNFERVWFYIDSNKRILVYTYEFECYELEVFLKLKNLSKYSIPLNFVKP